MAPWRTDASTPGEWQSLPPVQVQMLTVCEENVHTIVLVPNVYGMKTAPPQRLPLLRSSTPPSLSICMSYARRPALLFYNKHAELSGCYTFCKSPPPWTQPFYGCVTVCQSPLYSLIAQVKSMPRASNKFSRCIRKVIALLTWERNSSPVRETSGQLSSWNN